MPLSPSRDTTRLGPAKDSAAPRPVPRAVNTISPPPFAPLLAPSALTRPTPNLSRAQLDSVAAENMLRTLPIAVRNVELARKEDYYKGAVRAYERAKDEHRPVGIGLPGHGAIPAPFLSSGPSKRQRLRDSVILAGNIAGLQVLQARAKARLDSIRIADSLAAASRRYVPLR